MAGGRWPRGGGEGMSCRLISMVNLISCFCCVGFLGLFIGSRLLLSLGLYAAWVVDASSHLYMRDGSALLGLRVVWTWGRGWYLEGFGPGYSTCRQDTSCL